MPILNTVFLALICVFVFRFTYLYIESGEEPAAPAVSLTFPNLAKEYVGIHGDWGAVYLISHPDDKYQSRHINYALGKLGSRLYVNTRRQRKTNVSEALSTNNTELLMQTIKKDGFVGIIIFNDGFKQKLNIENDLTMIKDFKIKNNP